MHLTFWGFLRQLDEHRTANETKLSAVKKSVDTLPTLAAVDQAVAHAIASTPVRPILPPLPLAVVLIHPS